jgi:peptide/nickel transport system ATP-binding protein
MSDADPLLTVSDLHVRFSGDAGDVIAVDGVSFELGRDEVLGIVGESGSGKSATVMSVIGLLDANATVEGKVHFGGRDLLTLGADELRQVRGGDIAMVFQDPMTSLNPVYTVGWQIVEQLREHTGLDRDAAHQRVVELLRSVGLADPEQRFHDFPHQLSGGMRQRAMIALALSCNPSVLIADEPTTALDVTIQAQILDLIRRLRADHRSSVILITHDMGVIAEMTDRVVVMYDGKVVEQGSVSQLFADPLHPYTWGLLNSIPRLDRPRPRRLSAIAPPSADWSAPPGACVFASRCPHRFEPCIRMPELLDRRSNGHLDACHLPIEHRTSLRGASGSSIDGDA